MNAKQRRRERLKASAIERESDMRLGRKIVVIASGCSDRVLKAVTAAPNWRVKAEPEFVTQEKPEYRKVNNPYGQLTNARQKIRGCSIPLI